MSTAALGSLTLGNLVQWMEEWFLRLNFRERGSSTFASESDLLFFWIFAISTFFFVLLMVLMVWFAFRHRKRPGAVPERSRSHNTFLELSWSVIPTIILVWMFFEGFWGYTSAVIAPVEAQELMVSGQRWQWSITYPNGAASPETTRSRRMSPHDKAPERTDGLISEAAVDTPIFVVPENHPVSLRMSSTDVIHSFWVPDFRVKFDVFPNRYTSLWFEPTAINPANAATGKTAKGVSYTYEDHWVFCAEYCGANHSEMYAIMRVVPLAEYKLILAEWARPTGPWVEVGAKLYKIKGCNACHSVDGSRNVGPTWKNMYGYPVEFADGTRLSAEQMTGVEFANYVRESVLDPSKKLVATYPNQMQTFSGRIAPDEMNALIAYMTSLSDKKPASLSEVLGEAGNQTGPDAGAPTPNQPTPGTPSATPPSVTPPGKK
jgi:cytochrome c oxidase subunit 2